MIAISALHASLSPLITHTGGRECKGIEKGEESVGAIGLGPLLISYYYEMKLACRP